MGRVVIYGLLLCLAALTAYLQTENNEELPASALTASKPEAGPPGRSGLPEPPVDHRAVSVQGEPQLAEPRNLLVPEKDSREGERKLSQEAASRFGAGDFEGAVRLYRELSERDRSALAGLGMAYLRLRDYDNAERVLEQAVENDPGDFSSRKALAFLYFRKDDVRKGLSHAEAGLSMRADQELQRLYDKMKKDKTTEEVSESESTSHFRVTFDGYKHGGMSRRVLAILEDAYGTVGKEFGYFPATPVNTVLYTNRDFYDITQAPGWSGGIYDGKIRIPVRGAEGNEALLRKVLFHEYTHSVVRSLTQRCPLWVNEGLAEYFSKNYQKKIGQVIPLHMLGSSFSWLPAEHVAVAYWESYSAVSHLIDGHGLFRMKEFLLSLSKGLDLEQAFRDAFGQTYSEFVSSWGRG